MKYLFLVALFISISQGAFAQSLMQNYKTLCPQNWDSQACMSTVSNIVSGMAEMYEKDLVKLNRAPLVDEMKNMCAAATAAANGEYPARAMQSAFTECANGLYDLSTKTGLKPHANAYQLLISAIMCMSDDPSCSGIEAQLKR